MEDRETARMRKYGESKTTRIMMATVPHVISGLGLRKFQADGFLLTRVYMQQTGVLCRSYEKCFGQKLWRKSKHTFYVRNFFPPENRAVYETMRKNTVQPDRPKTTIWRTRVACWKTTATNTHSEYVILLLFVCTNAPHCYVTHALPACLVSLNVHYNAISTHAVHCLRCA